MNATLSALCAWINAKPWISPVNFPTRRDYLRAARLASRQRRHAIALLGAVSALPGIDSAALVEAGAGALIASPMGKPTEYRAAACKVLARALWTYHLTRLPEPSGYRVETIAGYDSSPVLTLSAASRLASEDAASYVFPVYRARKGKRAVTADGYLRWHFRRMLGNGITARYFT